MDRMYKFVRSGWPFIGPFLTILALGGVFKLSLDKINAAVLFAVPYVGRIPLGWLLLALFSMYFTFQSIRYRWVVLTILDLKLELHIRDRDGKDVRVVLEQKIRPHRENITGYLRKVGVTGSIPQSQYKAHISHAATRALQFDGSPSQWEIIHSFDKPIPVNPLRLGFDKPVIRKEEYVAIDSYTEAEEWHDLQIAREYRCRRFKIVVYFHRDRPRDAHVCSALRMSASGVVELPLNPIYEDPDGVELLVERPRFGERYRLIWKRKADWKPPTQPTA